MSRADHTTNPPGHQNSPRSRQPSSHPSGTQRPRPPRPPPRLSEWSTPPVQNSCWSGRDILLGAGMVIIQDNTHKVVVVHDKKTDSWFLPKGRKDIGESIETTACREAYEESGYRATLRPVFNPTRQPIPPTEDGRPGDSRHRDWNTEAAYMTMIYFRPRREREASGGEYLTFWYVGAIAENAVRYLDTGMADEKEYEGILLPAKEAWEKIYGNERLVLEYIWALYQHTLRMLQEGIEAEQRPETREADSGSYSTA